MHSLIIRTGPGAIDYSGNFVVGHTHFLDKRQFVMKYEGPIRDSIAYYRMQQGGTQTETAAARNTAWHIGKLPSGFDFEERAMVPLVFLDLVFPQAGVQNLEDLERIVAEELGPKPTAEQP